METRFAMSWSDFFGTLLPYLLISYAIVAGFVAFVLSGVQEGLRQGNGPSRWGIENWSNPRLIAMSALITAPSLLLFLPIGVFFVL